MMSLSRLKLGAKLLVSYSMYFTGLLSVWQWMAFRRKAVVLTYHRVLTRDERLRSASHPAIIVDREVFAWQMAFLKRRFRVLSLAEFRECLERKRPLPNSSCLVTFDDGWHDTFHNAYPVLKSLDLPAVVFLPVGFVGGRRVFWQEALARLLKEGIERAQGEKGLRERLSALLSTGEFDQLAAAAPACRAAEIARVVEARKGAPAGALDTLIGALERELAVQSEDFADIDGFLDWDQVRLMANGNVAFGGHGVEHHLLTSLTPAEAQHEIDGPRKVLDDALGRPADAFCYPNGYVTPPVVEQVRAAGYRLGFTTRRGFVQATDDPLTIGRLNVHDGVTSSEAMFLARLVGLF
jgi:peptidoglycan/xylan/chitin deacetylase (PgdA/CDA1 family)